MTAAFRRNDHLLLSAAGNAALSRRRSLSEMASWLPLAIYPIRIIVPLSRRKARPIHRHASNRIISLWFDGITPANWGFTIERCLDSAQKALQGS
jgi:hypothetical protein